MEKIPSCETDGRWECQLVTRSLRNIRTYLVQNRPLLNRNFVTNVDKLTILNVS